MPQFSKQLRLFWLVVLFYGVTSTENLMATVSEPSGDISKIRVWVREAGDHREGGLNDPKGVKSVSLKSLKSNQRTLKDFQYGTPMTYKVLAVKDIIGAAGLGAGTDLVILHMTNGMIIPLPYGSSDGGFGKINPYLATAVKVAGKWSSVFPPLTKPNEPKNSLADLQDPRPLRFYGNKLVVATGYLPAAIKEGTAGFSPWRFAGSLEGIEFADRAAYYRQYEVEASPEFVKGQVVFEQRCQFCHSTRTIGGRYGWDFVDPLPIYKQKEPTNLLFHVKYPKADALNRGLMMPTQKDITSEEAKALWTWMKAQAEKQQLKYTLGKVTFH